MHEGTEVSAAGSPSQAGIEMDAETALQHICTRSDVDSTRIVVYGKSLGGAVALHMASRHESQIRAAVVENSFLSVPEMVPRVFPFLGFAFGVNGFLNFLVRNKWCNREYVRRIKDTPLLLIASTKVSLHFLPEADLSHTHMHTHMNMAISYLHNACHISFVQDELVPFEHMQRINDLSVTKQKMWAECPNSGHMDAYEVDSIFYWQTVKAFWSQYVLS